jgi:hypothetical protein
MTAGDEGHAVRVTASNDGLDFGGIPRQDHEAGRCPQMHKGVRLVGQQVRRLTEEALRREDSGDVGEKACGQRHGELIMR